ncbi:hypothetical protein T10_7947 [Trichinella papuae]|uniref:Uncharacterized protein n=1 Tax=Trichinella papuae TaxID=268474 RepID=A0A0V1MEE4_9BILA|nr:hypothetical protein T10_7947 [Trichinella papuae]
MWECLAVIRLESIKIGTRTSTTVWLQLLIVFPGQQQQQQQQDRLLARALLRYKKSRCFAGQCRQLSPFCITFCVLFSSYWYLATGRSVGRSVGWSVFSLTKPEHRRGSGEAVSSDEAVYIQLHATKPSYRHASCSLSVLIFFSRIKARGECQAWDGSCIR